MPIKYLGSKRKFVDRIVTIASATGARTALDGLTGTTRVAQELKEAGMHVTASDMASYSKVFADCYITTDADAIDIDGLKDALACLMSLDGKDGYFTETFCIKSRFVRPKNGRRVDSVRDAIEEQYGETPLHPILLTSLIETTDRVDSTTGVQMAYLKQWAKRSYNDLGLRVPELLSGSGNSIQGDIFDTITKIGRQDVIYLDPPYNQHRYCTNYHIWETLVRWDSPDCYGVACKRIDSRNESTKSIFNKKRDAPEATRRLIDASYDKRDSLILSYNDESWIDRDSMLHLFEESPYDDWDALTFDYDRYVGARIGIYNPDGEKVGDVSHTKNHEYIFIAGNKDNVQQMRAAL